MAEARAINRVRQRREQTVEVLDEPDERRSLARAVRVVRHELRREDDAPPRAPLVRRFADAGKLAGRPEGTRRRVVVDIPGRAGGRCRQTRLASGQKVH